MDNQDNQDSLFTDLINKLNEWHTSPNTMNKSEPRCPLCDDIGWIRHVDGEYTSAEKCSCLVAKEAEMRIRNSGLAYALDNWKMDTFRTDEPWQQKMKATAERYIEAINAGEKPWFFIGGAVGSGKSHLATAMCGELLKIRHPVRYFQWLTDARRLKSYANDAEEYDSLLDRYLNVSILYIDDLFKSRHGKEMDLNPTDADIRLAFELLNGRYASNKPVVITSEWLLSELMSTDEAVFSRVHQKTKGFRLEVKRGEGRNFRMGDTE